MEYDDIQQFFPKMKQEFVPIVQKILRREYFQHYLMNVHQIKNKFPLPNEIPLFTYPTAENVVEFFQKHYQPILVDLEELSHKPNVKIKLYKNAVYYGEFHDNLRQGQGILIKESKQLYEGHFMFDKKEGLGFEVLKENTYYHGHFMQGFPNGEGVYQSDNQLYIGQWQHGKKSGIGYYEGIKDDYYLGNWENGKLFGQGMHVSDVVYIGEIVNDLKHGKGEEYFFGGDHYIGTYKNGQPNGLGKYTWKNGNLYEGEFQNGLRWGEGYWEQKTQNGISFYRGQYQQDQKNGKGHFKFQNGTEYIGHFQGDKRTGYGEMQWPDKAVYRGYWNQGLMEGEGIYNNKNINLQGIWKQNQFHQEQKVRLSLHQFPIQNQLKDIKEDEEITSKVAEEPDVEGLENVFKRISLQSKASLGSEQSKLNQVIQKQYDALSGLDQSQFIQLSQRTQQTSSVAIQTDLNSVRKKLITELPKIRVRQKKQNDSYSVEHSKPTKLKNSSNSYTNTNSPNTRESEPKVKNYSQDLKPRKTRKSLLTKIEEKVLQLRIERNKLSPIKYKKLWSKRVVDEAKQLLYPPIWFPPSLHPHIVSKN